MSLVTTVEESRARRREHILNALHYRRNGRRQLMRIELEMAFYERLYGKYFLGPCPF